MELYFCNNLYLELYYDGKSVFHKQILVVYDNVILFSDDNDGLSGDRNDLEVDGDMSERDNAIPSTTSKSMDKGYE